MARILLCLWGNIYTISSEEEEEERFQGKKETGIPPQQMARILEFQAFHIMSKVMTNKKKPPNPIIMSTAQDG